MEGEEGLFPGPALPMVDFSKFNIELDDEEIARSSVKEVASELTEKLKTYGFTYLKNYGVTSDEIEKVNYYARQFFRLPPETKEEYYTAHEHIDDHGWIFLEKEKLDWERKTKLMESYDIIPRYYSKKWPNKEVPGFQQTMVTFYDRCCRLNLRLLKYLAVGLNIEDTDVFRRAIAKRDQTSLRLLYYPPLAPGTELGPGQTRRRSHTDFSTITLLFQEAVEGMEVKSKTGEHILAPPLPGTVVVFPGDLVQRWTSDRLVGTEHRVVMPRQEACPERQSMAFFSHADEDFLIECLDGSGKYEPITGRDYMRYQFEEVGFGTHPRDEQ